MAYSYKILHGAKLELENIIEYLAMVNGISAVASFLEEYEKQITLICENPAIYACSRMRELANLGYRVALIKNYLMLYSVCDGTVYVSHFFHQKQDYAHLIFSS
jgi:plasmid stabilization system protein ParE